MSTGNAPTTLLPIDNVTTRCCQLLLFFQQSYAAFPRWDIIRERFRVLFCCILSLFAGCLAKCLLVALCLRKYTVVVRRTR